MEQNDTYYCLIVFIISVTVFSVWFYLLLMQLLHHFRENKNISVDEQQNDTFYLFNNL